MGGKIANANVRGSRDLRYEGFKSLCWNEYKSWVGNRLSMKEAKGV
jgi:hypothetical protein